MGRWIWGLLMVIILGGLGWWGYRYWEEINRNQNLKRLVKQQAVLLENRLAWVAMAKLDVNKIDFYEQNKTLLEKVKTTNKQIEQSIRDRQGKFINEIEDWQAKVRKIWEYDPETDLGIAKGDELAQRRENARLGLLAIEKQIDKPEVIKEIEKTRQVLSEKMPILKKQFYTLKLKAYDEQLKMMKSSEAVEMLRDETNMLWQFEWQIKKLSR